MTDKTYEDGLLEGKVAAIEENQKDHRQRINNHGDRLRVLERAMWVLAGTIAFAQLWPSIKALLQ